MASAKAHAGTTAGLIQAAPRGGASLDDHTLNDFRVTREKSWGGLFMEILTALTGRGAGRIGRISRGGERVRTRR